MRNSKRCFKASTVNCKIEAFKLVGEGTVNFQNFAYGKFAHRCAVSGSFYKQEFSNS
ncbi:hypothetical protein HMPREF9554_00456 [Treponema phagedenis F0421]|nr:hypothetical protein HMPREF9554_00456 [Treponema phagedenis F0421]